MLAVKHRKVLYLKVTAGKTNYAMIELPAIYPLFSIDGDEYRLQEQHISIFEDITEFSRGSVYHLTITLVDKMGQQYKLRGYYNAHDNLVGELSFKNFGVPGVEQEQPISSQTKAVLGAMMQAQVLPVLQRIHQIDHKAKKIFQDAYLSQVKNLIERFADLDKTSLSELKSLLKTTLKLDGEFSQLKRQLPYVNDKLRKRLIFDMQSCISKQSGSASLGIINPFLSLQSGDAEAMADEVTSPVASKVQQKKLKAKTKKKKAKKKSSSIPQDLQQLLVDFSRVESLDDDQDISQVIANVINLLDRAKQIDLFIAFDDSIANCDHLKAQNSNLIVDIEALLAQLLLEAVDTQQLDLLQEYMPYASAIKLQIIQLAIDNDDGALLRALFSQHNVDINRYTMPQETDGIPLFLYAYRYNKTEILKVLLEFDVNVLIADESGFPVLHRIISDIEDPYYPLMMKHISQKGLPAYCQQLTVLLQDYMSHTEIDDAQRNRILAKLETYRALQKLHLPNSIQERIVPIFEDTARQLAFVKLFPEPLQQMVKEDLDFIKLQNHLLEVAIHEMSKLSVQQYRNLRRFNVNHADQILLDVDPTIMKSLNKEILIAILQHNIDIFPITIEVLIMSNFEPQKKIFFHGKDAELRAQHYNALCAHLNQKSEEIGEMLSKHVSSSMVGMLSRALQPTLLNQLSALKRSVAQLADAAASLSTTVGRENQTEGTMTLSSAEQAASTDSLANLISTFSSLVQDVRKLTKQKEEEQTVNSSSLSQVQPPAI